MTRFRYWLGHNMTLHPHPVQTPTEKHREKCQTLLAVLKDRGVDPAILEAFQRLVRSNVALVESLRRERAENTALRIRLGESTPPEPSRFFFNRPDSFNFRGPDKQTGDDTDDRT